MLIDDARWILAAWRDRLLDDDDVQAWTLEAIDSTPAADLPAWLLDLCTLGATACMTKPSADFIWVPFLEFHSAFSLHLQACNFGVRTEVDALVASPPSPSSQRCSRSSPFRLVRQRSISNHTTIGMSLVVVARPHRRFIPVKWRSSAPFAKSTMPLQSMDQSGSS